MTSDGIRTEIRNLVLNHDAEGLALRLPKLTDAERATVAAELPGLLAELRESPLLAATVGWDAFDWTADDQVTGPSEVLMMVGAATIPGPAGVATWLMKRDLNPRWSGAPSPHRLVKAVSGRPVAWRADLAVRLARRIRRPDDRIVPPALALLRDVEATPPDHEPLVAAWLSAVGVAKDPLTPHLLPKIFEAAGAGRALVNETLTPKPSRWLALAARTLPREQIITGCVSRFLLGGDAQDLRFFVRLHTLVAPTPEESAGRLRDYLRLLPAAPGPVAELAWQQVRQARLDPADVAEAIEAMTFRREAKLAVKGLTWLDRDLATAPERVADHVTALTNAYGHASHEVRDRAVTLTLKHADHLTDPAPILEAAELLPPASARQLFERFTEGWTSDFTPGRLPEATIPGPFPTSGLESGPPEEIGWIDVEAWLAAITREAHTNPDSLKETLARRFGEHLRPVLYDAPTWQSPRDWCTALARELVNPGEDPGPPMSRPPRQRPSYRKTMADAEQAFPGLSGDLGQALYDGMVNVAATAFQLFPGLRTVVPLHEMPDYVQEEILRAIDVQTDLYDPKAQPAPWNRLPHLRECARPHAFLLSRLDELLRAAKAGALPPVLLATPTRADGHLDPETLLNRLAVCAESGCEPLPLDLEQALLRLPPNPAPDLAERAKGIGSAAAAVVARWFERGAPPPPEVEVTWTLDLGSRVVPYDDHVLDQRGIANVSWQPVEPAGLAHLDALLTAPEMRPFRRVSRHFWPGMTPHHRELAAAHLAIGLIDRFDPPDITIDDLRNLTLAEGASGPATALVLAYFLTVEGDDAVPPLLQLAAKGALPAAETGRLLGLFGRRTRYEADPALPSLELAAKQGAHAEVWTILRHFLAVFLPREGERAQRLHTDAVMLAIDIATWADARGEIPEVAAHAKKRGSTSLIRVCRSLHQFLTREA
ncbi:hypothetical protein Aple_072980 [Acrocarpospora pleiomorpha]|uniref:Secreted protein n=1 Tax=Acrocarpospora pleiomorpha TaxID=90975 RepID=A0A5M3XWE6_9ACTN|nr:hypothetical protein [Acrocarpospora pleiomorpha]GES24399.1 hypothetical protein Aple_072980 [Acrocarpospora pleiomorpha]